MVAHILRILDSYGEQFGTMKVGAESANPSVLLRHALSPENASTSAMGVAPRERSVPRHAIAVA
ncbi:hypothetical protein [Microbacterium sp. R86528]|uniref:hypothetical protein n=1 Tax=Microbacterium sp. R86528 TaxID=3093864 RepID=UPI0037CB06DE